MMCRRTEDPKALAQYMACASAALHGSAGPERITIEPTEPNPVSYRRYELRGNKLRNAESTGVNSLESRITCVYVSLSVGVTGSG